MLRVASYFSLVNFYRSSCSQMFFKIGVLKTSAIFTGKTPDLESLFSKVAGLKACNFVKDNPTQVFSCEYCKIFKNTFFYKTPSVAAFAFTSHSLPSTSYKLLF